MDVDSVEVSKQVRSGTMVGNVVLTPGSEAEAWMKEETDTRKR